jgi:hypothetical protein
MKTSLTVTAPLYVNPFLDRAATRGLNALLAVRLFKKILGAIISGLGSKRVNSANVRLSNTVEFGLKPAVALVTAAAPATSATITINGTAQTAAQHRASCTVTFASVANARTITVNGLVITAKTSPSGAYEFARGGTDAADALAFVNCLNALTVAGSTAVTAAAVYGLIEADRPAANGVVNIYAIAEGTAGNSYTIATSNGGELAITNDSSGSFANGAAATNNQFDHIGSNARIARSIVNNLALSSTAIINKHVAASCRKAIVTCATVLSGSTVTIDGTRLRAIKETTDSGGARVASFPDDVFGIDSSDTTCAVGLVNCINNHPKLSERFHAVNSSGVVTIRERPPEQTTPPPISTSDGSTLAVTATTNGCFADSTGVLIQSLTPGHGGNGTTLATSSGVTLAITLDSTGRLAGGTSAVVTY